MESISSCPKDESLQLVYIYIQWSADYPGPGSSASLIHRHIFIQNIIQKRSKNSIICKRITNSVVTATKEMKENGLSLYSIIIYRKKTLCIEWVTLLSVVGSILDMKKALFSLFLLVCPDSSANLLIRQRQSPNAAG